MMKRLFGKIDPVVMVLAILLLGISILTLYSTGGSVNGEKANLYQKQIIWFSIGIILMILITMVDYRIFSDFSYIIYGLSLFLLILTLFVGKSIAGSKSWIDLGPINIQTSEIVKVSVILLMATFLAGKKGEKLGIIGVGVLLLIVGIPFVLIMMQPDMGTALTYAPVVLVGILLSGIRLRTLLTLFIIIVIIMPFGWLLLEDYQKERVLTVLNPSKDLKGSGYQLMQSKIAIGSGEILGRGLFSNTQSRLHFLPALHTDFILSVFAEVSGFLGVSLLLILYILLFQRILNTAQVARDRLGFFIAMGVFSILAFQVILNIGMVIGFFPTVGIPLPLLSYGGSSVVSTMISLGLVMNVRMNRIIH
jgi:rod shape determining protein RodA